MGQDGISITPHLVETYDVMIGIFNDAIRELPPVKCGPGSKYGLSCPTAYPGTCGWPFDCDENGKFRDD